MKRLGWGSMHEKEKRKKLGEFNTRSTGFKLHRHTVPLESTFQNSSPSPARGFTWSPFSHDPKARPSTAAHRNSLATLLDNISSIDDEYRRIQCNILSEFRHLDMTFKDKPTPRSTI